MISVWHRKRPDEELIAREAAERVVEATLAAARSGGAPIRDVGSESLHHEELRLSHAEEGPRSVAARRALDELWAHRGATAKDDEALLRLLVRRYSEEIQGRFDPSVYSLVTSALPLGLSALLHRIDDGIAWTPERALTILDRHILIEGAAAKLQRLSQRGTILLVPTHSSNLDSVVVGHAIFRLGLPPFIYGAGLNLFTNPVLGFFMRHLGAYTVDRTKTDPLYRRVLKEYATVALEQGHHGLFFPGGTRSRSGKIEERLKLGLLGTGVTALGRMLARGRRDARVFIVPCTISYPLVLEARSLIDGYLRNEGHERDVAQDECSAVHRWLDYLRGLAALDQRIHVTFGDALDPIGNLVDDDGESLDPSGQRVDVARYLTIDGQPAPDEARDAAYTRELGDRVLTAFRRHCVALPTNLLAFVMFEALRARSTERDPLSLLPTLGRDAEVPLADVRAALTRVMTEIRELDARGELRASTTTRTHDVEGLLRHALEAFRTYHARPVVEARGTSLVARDPALLLYYRNRLEGLRLPGSS